MFLFYFFKLELFVEFLKKWHADFSVLLLIVIHDLLLVYVWNSGMFFCQLLFLLLICRLKKL